MKPALLTLLGLALLGFVGWLWKHKRKMRRRQRAVLVLPAGYDVSEVWRRANQHTSTTTTADLYGRGEIG